MLRRLVKRAKRVYFVLRNVRAFLRKEHELHGWPDCWADARFLLAGFHSDKRFLYELGPNRLPPPTYVGDLERLLLRRLNEPYAAFLDHKALFAQVFGTQFPVPVDYGLVQRGLFIPLTDGYEVAPITSALADPALPDRYVVKTVGGGGGKDVLLVTRDGDEWLEVNDERLRLPELVKRLGARTYVVTTRLGQGTFAAGLYPYSVNTVRVVTMRDVDGPFVAFAVQRIGAARSRPTDNLNRGGLAALVDLETGMLGPAKRLEADRHAEAYDRHPETGAGIAGTTIPGWNGLVTMLLETMEAFPPLRYVGWDVVIGDDEVVVLEGNSYPGVQVAQLHRPLRTDPRVRRFFENVATGIRR